MLGETDSPVNMSNIVSLIYFGI